MSGGVRFGARVVLALAAFLAFLPLHAVAGLAGSGPGRAATLWHRCAIRIMGIRVSVTGSVSADRPLLLLFNHISWIDIPVLASILPVSFVAKQEVETWPVIGWLARLQSSVFIDREKRHVAAAKAEEMASRLARGDALVLFPEGTSSDGNRILPFRTALVGSAGRAVAAGGGCTVQPVAIAYTRMHGIPLGRQHRPLIAWYGGTVLLPHLKHVLSEGAIDLEVVFGPPRRLTTDHDRKRITAEAEQVVRHLVAGLNAGRNPAALLAETGGTDQSGESADSGTG